MQNQEEKLPTLHHRMAAIKLEISKRKIPKSGLNKFTGFRYHELTDFMPIVNELNAKYGVNAYPKFLKNEGICVLTLVNSDDKTDFYEVIIPYVDAEMLAKGGGQSVVDAIQRLGSTITYNRRYLYQSGYDITENDCVESLPLVEIKEKPELSDDRFAAAIEKIAIGQYTKEELKEKFNLTKQQLAQL
jgi:hypothetical protein